MSKKVIKEENAALVAELQAECRSLSAEETASVIRVPKWKLFTMVKEGQAPKHFTIGREFRFTPAAIRKWFAERGGES